jgi:SNF2 family DNA or RNA helicase
MLDILEDYLNYRGYSYVRLDGSTHEVEREFNIKRYNTDPSIFVFLISSRAGSLGKI